MAPIARRRMPQLTYHTWCAHSTHLAPDGPIERSVQPQIPLVVDGEVQPVELLVRSGGWRKGRWGALGGRWCFFAAAAAVNCGPLSLLLGRLVLFRRRVSMIQDFPG